jgi:beta-glucosidase
MRFWAAIFLAGAAACGGSGGGTTPDSGAPDSGTPDSGTPDSGTPDSGTPDSGTPDGGTTAECDKAANVAKKSALVAAQPVFTAGTNPRTRTILTATTHFTSVAGDATVQCPVDLKFKDLDGNGALDPYEDWTQTASARATDLLGRMTADQKLALLAHATLSDAPTVASPAPVAATQSAITAGIRYGEATGASNSPINARATWANDIQAAAEAAPLGVPFVISSEPIHSQSAARTKARGFSQWPQEPGIAASGDTALAKSYGQVVAAEYRAVGISMALSPSADLATEPRWFNAQFTFGEDAASVSAMAAAYVQGLQGLQLSATSVAAVVGHFPGAGPAQSGWDARLSKGKYTVYPGSNLDGHLAAFQGAFSSGVAGVMPGYGIPQSGSWTALSGVINGSTLEQVGAAYNKTLLTDALRTHYGFAGLVVAPQGVLEDAGLSPLGAPWGQESATKAQRIGKAVTAGVDQFIGLGDTSALAAAKTGGQLTDAQVSASALRALKLIFQLGLFENPYVDPTAALATVNSDPNYRAGLDALDKSMVLVVNATKPAGWLNGGGNGTQSGDKGNAGNGSGRVLPAPPGEPYVSAGCRYYIGAGNMNLDYVRSVSAGYGELTNDESTINGKTVTTEADKMAASDYVFIRISAPFTADPDSGALNYSLASLEYGSSDNQAANAALLQPIKDAQAAIASHTGSKTQIVVGVDAGRASVVSEIVALGVSGLYLEWGVTDKVFLDVAFGIVDGKGTLPMGLPLSDAAVAAQKSDVAGDGEDATFVKGFGFQTTAF